LRRNRRDDFERFTTLESRNNKRRNKRISRIGYKALQLKWKFEEWIPTSTFDATCQPHTIVGRFHSNV